MNMIINYAVEIHTDKNDKKFKNDRNNKISDILFIIVICVIILSIILGISLYFYKSYHINCKFTYSKYNILKNLPTYEIDFSTYKKFNKCSSFTANISEIANSNNFFDIYKVSEDNSFLLHLSAVNVINNKITFNIDHNYKKYIIVYVPLQDIVLNTNHFKIGKTFQKTLEYELVPNNCTNSQITYVNNSENIASIDAFGIISGLQIGSTSIQVGVEGEKVLKKVYIDVLEIVEDLTIDTNNINLHINESKKVNVSIIPQNATNSKLFWTTSNENIAKVDANGNITAMRFWNL